MQRNLLLAVVVSAVVSACVTAATIALVLPSVVEAQAQQLLVQSLTVAGANGDGLRLQVRDTGGGLLQLIGSDGKTVKATLASGGAGQSGAPSALGTGLNVFSPDQGDAGATVARIGTATSTGLPQTFLQDKDGNRRFQVTLDKDGNALIEIRDADGNLVWSAP